MSRSRNGMPGAETIAAKGGHYLNVNSGAITPAIDLSTTFARDDRYEPINAANLYSRDNSPTFIHAERTIAELEGGESCLLFGSGMAAIAAIFYTLKPGSHVVLPDSMYWGAFSWIRLHCDRSDIVVSYYDPADAAAIEAAIEQQARTDIVWVETPTNPMMKITDIALAADIAHSANALLCVDSTAATPVFTRPLELGADLVMHSATKYLNGHSDVLAGALVTREGHDLWERLGQERHLAGAVPGNLEAWLLLRGIRTLYVRVQRAADSAMRIATMLQSHDAIDKVLYPGFPKNDGKMKSCFVRRFASLSVAKPAGNGAKNL